MKSIVVEGIGAGALGASAVASWFLLYDVAHGRPFFHPGAARRRAVSRSPGRGDREHVVGARGRVLVAALGRRSSCLVLPRPRCWRRPTASRLCCLPSLCWSAASRCSP